MKHKLLAILPIISILISLNSCDRNRKIEKLTLISKTLVMNAGEEIQLEVIISPLSATVYNSVSWKSSDENVAKVDNKGNISAVYAGECYITVSYGNIKDECFVSVDAPDFALEFTKAYAKIIDDKENIKSKIFNTKFFDHNITYDTINETIDGDGLMLNLILKSKYSNEKIDTGTYLASSANDPKTFSPGELIYYEGNYYATGSFLGQYENGALVAAVYINNGKIDIDYSNNKYSVNTQLTGEAGEKITSKFNNEIYWIAQNNNTKETIELKYDSTKVWKAGLTTDEKKTVYGIILYCAENTNIIQYLVVPSSSENTIPAGNYKVSTDEGYFSVISYDLSPYCAWITQDRYRFKITSGYININYIDNELICNAHYKDIKERVIFCDKK